ncbi:MAG: alpha/beta hydrolase [Lachnospiraceae bacterium]|nr:alpha/beta hydrolase [Lachnospiraceae bacterium]
MTMQIEGVRVNLYHHGDCGACIYVGESARTGGDADRLDELLEKEAEDMEYNLIVFEISDWNSQLSPWPARPAFGDEAFGGRGSKTCTWLVEKCIPELKVGGFIPKDARQYIAGYSLSGLFSLWALLESDVFDGAASCSGSLWIDGWMEHIRSKKLMRDAYIYLSLGSKEERTKNPLMSTVGDCTRETYELLKKNPAVKKTVLQWNKRGHFADVDARLVKGIVWLLRAQERRR